MIYLDSAAAAEPYEDIAEEVFRSGLQEWANPSSLHRAGQAAAAKLEEAREELAALLGAAPSEILFAPSGTLSANAAILGYCRQFSASEAHFLCSAVEHASVLSCFRELEREGYRVSYAAADGEGIVSAGEVRRAIRPDTKLVSVMAANNELGSVEPIEEIAEISHQANAQFHTDAVALFGRRALNVANIDMLSAASHKIGGPRGIGLLYRRKGLRFSGPFFGGAQEKGVFPGTVPSALALGFAKAARRSLEGAEGAQRRMRLCEEAFSSALLRLCPIASLNGPKDPRSRLAGYVSASFEGLRSDRLLSALSQLGVCCSAGAACSAGSLEPSHVIEAVRPGYGLSTLRFTFGRKSTVEEALAAASLAAAAALRLLGQ
jgi:cysteine desulfurase